MNTNSMAGQGPMRAGLLVLVAFATCACVADSPGNSDQQSMSTATPAQPRHSTYNCGEDGVITVQNMRSAVRLLEPDGDAFDLPASPPAQASRYGEGGFALVLEGREALWMKAGSTPITCQR